MKKLYYVYTWKLQVTNVERRKTVNTLRKAGLDYKNFFSRALTATATPDQMINLGLASYFCHYQAE